jgi:hypothetical protein
MGEFFCVCVCVCARARMCTRACVEVQYHLFDLPFDSIGFLYKIYDFRVHNVSFICFSVLTH